MPPALSDDENSASSGAEEDIPFRGKGKAKAEASPEPVDDDVDDEVEEDEYVIEVIVSHRVKGKKIEYEVKWQGYDDEADRTWEPEQNLAEGASEALDEYWAKIGGRPEIGGKGASGKKRGRKSNVEADTPTAAATTKRPRKEKDWSPPPGSWEHDVDYVETVEENVDPKTGKMVRYAYLVWTNRNKTQHPLEHIYLKCPQKMLRYYESHLVFTQPGADDYTNGDKELITEDDL